MTTGLVHFLAAIVALTLGGAALLAAKGSRHHKWLGRAYSASMGVLLAAAFVTYDVDGRFGPFHAMAIFSSLTLFAGLLPYWTGHRGSDSVRTHANFMAWSYIGLVAAGASQLVTKLVSGSAWLTVLVTSFVVIALGVVALRHWLPGAISSVLPNG